MSARFLRWGQQARDAVRQFAPPGREQEDGVQCADQEIRFLQTPSPTDLPLPDLSIMLARRRPDGGLKRLRGAQCSPAMQTIACHLTAQAGSSAACRRNAPAAPCKCRAGCRGSAEDAGRRVAATLNVSRCDPSGSSASACGAQSTLPRHLRRSHACAAALECRQQCCNEPARIRHTGPISKHWTQPQPMSSPRSSLERCRQRSKLKFLYFAGGGSRHVGQNF